MSHPFSCTLLLSSRFAAVRAFFLAAALAGAIAAPAATPPQVGDEAPAFTLPTLDGRPVDFAELRKGRTAVLVVLRGWPGYQCPLCTRQVNGYVARAADFAARDTAVVMVYPGPAADLQAHAQEFLGDKRWPANFHFVLDPDYAFTNRHGLRWDAKGETAYPSTFIIDAEGKVRFAHVSHEHGDRVDVGTVLHNLGAAK